MFERVFDLGMVRTTKQAWGFYITHFLILISAGLLLGFIYGLLAARSTFSDGVRIGGVAAAIYVGCISYLIFLKKRLITKTKYIFGLLGAIILALMGGALLGMIIPAVVTTKPVDSLQQIPPTASL